METTFGRRLKQLRQDKNLRQDQLASLIGLNKTAIHYYETDQRQPPYDTLIRLATIFNVTTDFLLGCERNSMLDVSGLTPAEIKILRTLVADMAEKNKQLNDC